MRPHAAEFSSPGPPNKARHTGFHYSVEPDARRDAPNLPHGVFRYGRQLEVLLDAAGRDRSGQESCAALYCPGEHDLGRGFAEALCDSDDHRIIQ
jgi:hypothetical protein